MTEKEISRRIFERSWNTGPKDYT